uniref:Ycf1 n=1 Tax=Filipendula palmata TaxID=1769926 RepID=UPI0023F4FFFB|nr:Ycf1 [Filipendula palmata]YP_010727195.1 Ycf1 [Filipendula intermedia]YP_010727435.1 Ycf1 [Filipendula angustiloba]WDZ66633.1 Ycf1 [Filipendula palmata]WDZ66793.1 Ycf1 [Filipendula intermedia]WDZ67033.1 Ycf1 [Filipendula angustiloba]
MFLKSFRFILGNLVSLCMKIINSVLVVGLYYGFLSTLSVGPSYLLLIGTRYLEKESGKEGDEKIAAATIGFVIGQLIIFISIYYEPLHLALGNPHTITVLALPSLFFNFFWYNNRDVFDYGPSTTKKMRNLSNLSFYLNSLIFQLFNHFLLPSSTLARLVNIYMFRCNNAMLFVTGGFIGWIIGNILFITGFEWVLNWMEHKYSTRQNKRNIYLLSEFRSNMYEIFIPLVFSICVSSLGRMPSPIFTHKLKETSKTSETEETEEKGESEEETDGEIETTYETEETEERGESEEETDGEIETTYETKGIQQEQERSTEQDPSLFSFEKPIVTCFFDSKPWNRPLRYIKNNQFENAIRNEMSQYFFYTCQSDGKERISFTYPPSLATFLEMMQRKMTLVTKEKDLSNKFNEFDNHWSYTNEHKNIYIIKNFINRLKVLDKNVAKTFAKKSVVLNVLEKRTRLCNDKTKKKYLPKVYDPFLNGAYRGRIKKLFSLSTINENEIYIKNYIEKFWINKIHGLLLIINRFEFEHKLNPFHTKSLSNEIYYLFNLINEFTVKSASSLNFKKMLLAPEHEQVRIDSEHRIKILKFLSNAVRIIPNNKTIKKKIIEIKEIYKKVPRWSYRLITELEHESGETLGTGAGDPEIRSRPTKRVVIFTSKKTKKSRDQKENPVILTTFSNTNSDFRREIIKGTMRAQRRKVVTCRLMYQEPISPLFAGEVLNGFQKIFFEVFYTICDIFENIQIIFINLMWPNPELTTSEEKKPEKHEKETKKDKKEKEDMKDLARVEIAEAWDTMEHGQPVRCCLLLTHSFLRKYIIFPPLIIVKNIIRMILFQIPEWSGDFKDWKKEMHVKCTYGGVPLSENEFPKNWLEEGMQIKIMFPFRLKPWHPSNLGVPDNDPQKNKDSQNDFCFLTVFGLTTDRPFGSGRKPNLSLFFEPIFKELKIKIRKFKKKCFIILRVSKEQKKQILKSTHFLKLKEIKKKYFEKIKKIKVDELSQTKNDSIINNLPITDSAIQKESLDFTNYSLTEKKMQDLTDKTNTILNQIQKIKKEKKKVFRKKLWQRLKRINIRLIRKSHYFIKFFIETIDIDIFLCIINIRRYISNIRRINTQTFIKSTKKNFNKYIKRNQERIDKKNKSEKLIDFISSIKESLYNTNISNENATTFCGLSYFPQDYVFYKLLQTQLFNLSRLKPVFEYKGTSLFIKNEIKDYFGGTQQLFNSELRHKNCNNSGMNQWITWLKNHYQYQYDISQISWSRLVPQKWRNRFNEHYMAQNKDLCDSSKKTKLIRYEKLKNFETGSLLNERKSFQKQYRYDLLAYKFINSENKKYSSIYGSPLNVKKNQKVFSNFHNNYIVKDSIKDMEKNIDRKYFYCRIINFSRSKTGNRDNQEIFFDWMGMNEEILNGPISNSEHWFFPELLILYNFYKNKPWVIPIKLLLLDSNIKENTKNEKKFLELKKRNKRPTADQANLESALSNQERDIEEDSTGTYVEEDSMGTYVEEYSTVTDVQKDSTGVDSDINQNYKNSEIDFAQDKFLVYQFRWGNDFVDKKIIENIKIYCLLLRVRNPRELALFYIRRRQLNMDFLVKNRTISELIKRGIFILEPLRLSMQNDGQFIVYQTISISLVHKSKHQINKKYRQKKYIDKNFDESITKNKKMTRNSDKNYYDLLVPENILSPRLRREFRIIICLNSRKRDDKHNNSAFGNRKKVNSPILDKNTRYKKKLMKLKLFLWPNYRLEDLASMNRYWFNTNNGSRFSMLGIHIYLPPTTNYNYKAICCWESLFKYILWIKSELL